MLNFVTQVKPSLPYNNKNKFNTSFKGRNNTLCSDVLEIRGSQTSAKVFTDNINYQTYEQIKKICSHPVFKDIPVRIMPDVHAENTAVVGFTAPVASDGKIIPSLISGDIGCGMLCVKFDAKSEDIDFEKLDNIIKQSASASRTQKPKVLPKYSKQIEPDIEELCKKYKVPPQKSLNSLGTIGGGNHFIEIDKGDDGANYLVIHTGSRLFGKEVYDHHQKIAQSQNPYKIKDLSYLSSDEAKEYLEDMQIAVKYSQLNRRLIADEIIKRMGWRELSSFESIHNYISEDGMIRKGAINAEEGKELIIPLNMRDGAIIGKGKGNDDWNKSAPHGAGRQFSRSEASELISLDEYRNSMNNIYSSCISESTIDESPQSYKDSNEILSKIPDTVDVLTRIRPIFNFKD